MSKKNEIYRIGERGVGPDYRCHKCGLQGYRMWRMGASSCVELTCAACAEKDQAKQIEQYKSHRHPDHPGCTIGDLVPARPDVDQTWWGHTSGDAVWWYRLPQYVDLERELALVRSERDSYCIQTNYYMKLYLEEGKRASEMRNERDEAFRIAKIKEL